MVKTAMKRASQERLGHGTRRKSKTLSRTTPPTGVSEESSARARTWTDCHNAELCLESAMTLVTASCPFQRARPLQCDYSQELSTHHPPSSSAASGEVLWGVWWTLPKVGTTLFFTLDAFTSKSMLISQELFANYVIRQFGAFAARVKWFKLKCYCTSHHFISFRLRKSEGEPLEA